MATGNWHIDDDNVKDSIHYACFYNYIGVKYENVSCSFASVPNAQDAHTGF